MITFTSLSKKVFSRLRHEIFKGTFRDRTLSKEAIKKLVNSPTPVIIEIGAADGLDTLEFLKTFDTPDLKLICFEPDPRNIEKFKSRILDNRVILIEKAVGDKNGVTKLNMSSTEYSSSLKKPVIENFQREWPEVTFEETVDVQVVTLDSEIARLGLDHIDFIWADVQGAEDLLIKGASATLGGLCHFFYTEYSDNSYYENEPNLATIRELLGPTWHLKANYKTDALFESKRNRRS